MKILNCTNHAVTENQILMGIVEPEEQDKKIISDVITFHDLPTEESIKRACDGVVSMVKKYSCDAAMIGGAPFLQGYLEESLFNEGLCAAFAFSKRIVKERKLEDGSVEKVSVFDSSDTIVKQADGSIFYVSLKK